MRTWEEFVRYYDSDATDEVIDFVLMEETAFPFSTPRMTSYQARSSIRAAKNGIKRCWARGMKIPYHSYGCPAQHKEKSNGL